MVGSTEMTEMKSPESDFISGACNRSKRFNSLLYYIRNESSETFHKLVSRLVSGEIVSSVGKMNLFDTLVYNYRLKESIPTENILDVAEILTELIVFLTDLSDGLKMAHKTLTKQNVNERETHEVSKKLMERSLRVELVVESSILSSSVSTANLLTLEENASLLIEPSSNSAEIIETRNDCLLAGVDQGSMVKEPPPESTEGIEFYCCDRCLYSFKSLDSFNSHQCVVTGKQSVEINNGESAVHFVQNNGTLQSLRKFICGLCLEEHRSFVSIVFHLKNCDGGPFFCELCPNSSTPPYPTRKALNIHKLLNHKEEKSFICSECGNSFKAKCSLQRHRLSAHERFQGPFKCELCEEVFEKRIILTNHKFKCHALEPEFLCQECGGRYSSKATLLTHLKQQHSETKRFICQYCCKQFSRKDKLQVHEMVHTRERPFVCEICGKRLTRKSKLDGHIRLHLKEKFNPMQMSSNTSAPKINLHLLLKRH